MQNLNELYCDQIKHLKETNISQSSSIQKLTANLEQTQ